MISTLSFSRLILLIYLLVYCRNKYSRTVFLIFVESTACSHDHLYPTKPDEKPPMSVALNCICIRKLLLTEGHDNQACFLIFVDSTTCSHHLRGEILANEIFISFFPIKTYKTSGLCMKAQVY